MSITEHLQEIKKLEIQAYEKPKDTRSLKLTHVPFSGSPRKHPYDPDRVILIVDPYSTNIFYYEFLADDISYVEELPSLVNENGETITMVRLWVKKMSVGLRCTPFLVQDISSV
ncbi:MAG TPA: inorganic pyrophosphatase Ppa [Deltaproteobacteria bacterium]|nr:inorganic pyrophosphatase Ppa [Deltaproteobacteria bacterium]